MRTVLRVLLSVTLLLVASGAIDALAQPPDRLEHFRFIPRRSILHVQGGFAGFDIRANIHGQFDFVTGFHRHSGDPVSSLDPYAAFANVDAVAINPTDFGPYSFDLDETLNLSGLHGKPIPLGAPFDLYHFEGREPQGGAMELHVVRFGPWLLMAGESEAPPNTADFFEYEIRAIAHRSRFADFNEDDRVDRHDLHRWQSDFGRAALTGADFLAAQRQQGEVMPSLDDFAATASGTAAATVIPEPATLVMILGFVALSCSRRVRRQA